MYKPISPNICTEITLLLGGHSQATLKGTENKQLYSQNYWSIGLIIFVTWQQVCSFLMRALNFCPCFSHWCE